MHKYQIEVADFYAKAYAPGHITGFFQIYEHENPHRKGSTGCGIVLNGGVTTEVKVGESEREQRYSSTVRKLKAEQPVQSQK